MSKSANDFNKLKFDKAYQVAKTKPIKEITRTFFSKIKTKVNCFDLEASKKKFVPAPTKYGSIRNWSKTKDRMQQFSSAKRLTVTDQILSRKKLKEPGPGTYKTKQYKIVNVSAPKQVTQQL